MVLALLFSFSLTACSLDEEAASLYKQESVLDIDVILPEDLSLQKPMLFQAILRQDGKMVDNAEDVIFEIWKNDNPSQVDKIKATNDGNGVYSAEKAIDEDGLYYVKVQASANGSRVMPTKQFVVGKLSEEDKNSLHHHEHDHDHDGHH